MVSPWYGHLSRVLRGGWGLGLPNVCTSNLYGRYLSVYRMQLPIGHG